MIGARSFERNPRSFEMGIQFDWLYSPVVAPPGQPILCWKVDSRDMRHALNAGGNSRTRPLHSLTLASYEGDPLHKDGPTSPYCARLRKSLSKKDRCRLYCPPISFSPFPLHPSHACDHTPATACEIRVGKFERGMKGGVERKRGLGVMESGRKCIPPTRSAFGRHASVNG